MADPTTTPLSNSPGRPGSPAVAVPPRPEAAAGLRDRAISQGIVDSLVVGVMQIAADGQVTFANAFGQELMRAAGLGCQIALQEFGPTTFWPDGSVCPVEDYPAIKCLSTGEPQGPTTLGVRATGGETIWLTISATPIVDSHTGRIQGTIATFIDVSHSKQVEESLRQSEDRYRQLVEGAPDAILVHRDLNIVYCNAAAVRLWGGDTQEQFLGRSILEFVHPRFRELVKRRVSDVRSGTTVPLMDQVHLRVDGKPLRVEVTGMPCIYDGQPSVQAILRDVTERRRVERQVRRQREILQKFFDRIPVLVGIFSRDGAVKRVNREWTRVLGWGRELSAGQMLDRCYPDPEQRHAATEYFQAAPPGWKDFRVLVRDGRTLDISWANIVLSNGTRIGIGQDVTDRKRAEAILRQNQAELEKRVSERTQELIEANEQLRGEITVRRQTEAKLHEKQGILEQMLSTHEHYRQIVAYEIHDTFVQDVIGALMYLDLYHDTHREVGETGLQPIDKSRSLLREAVSAARRMISGLRPPIIDEQGVVAALEYLAGEMTARGIEVSLEHDVQIGRLAPMVEAAIFRIVQEALNNVERHSNTKYARVSLVQQGDHLQLKITDFGAGFDPQTVAAGHFGLSGMAERARLFGGTMTVESAPGKGTEVVVDIPLTETLINPAPGVA